MAVTRLYLSYNFIKEVFNHMKKKDIDLIGVYIKSLRLSKGWSQAKLGKLTGLSESYISNIERSNKGPFYNMSLPSLTMIAHAFRIKLWSLLSCSGYICAIGDEEYGLEDVSVYIENKELINFFYRLTPSQQQDIIHTIKTTVNENDKQNQQQMYKKNLK